MEFTMHPIGIIHSPFMTKKQTPIQPVRSAAQGKVEIFKEFEPGLNGIEGFSHLILIYVFDRSEGYQLQIKPFLDDREHGLFTTRYPYRPNPIGLSIVELISREGNILTINGVDVLENTPLLDIKPYMPEFDIRQNVRAGWYENRSKP